MKNYYLTCRCHLWRWLLVKHHLAQVFLALLMIVSLSVNPVLAQERIITGKVTDAKDNAALPGVNILLKGTTRGTVTDANGEFKLSAGDQDVLIFSQIGFETREISVASQTTINITLSESTSVLNEVVVTALGISQEKRSLGYSIQEVRGDDIMSTQRPNFMVSLQGRVAGLSMISTSGLPGSSTSITLRGVSSISGSNQPLIVVDGLPVENRVFDQHNLVSNQDNRNNDYLNRAADINPNDIASVTVLKGPEAAALYGQGGASGAILITTKRGAAGGLRINYDNNFGFQKVNRFPEIQTTYGRGDFGFDNPLIEELSYFGKKYAEGTQIYNNKDKFFRTGYNQNHNLTFEGGTDLLSNRFSVNYFKQDGVVPNNTYEKFSARLTSSMKLANKLESTTTINYVFTNNVKPTRGTSGFLLGVLSWPSNDDISNYLNPDGTRRRLIPDLTSPATIYSEPNNPFFSVYKNANTDKTNRVLANTSLSYDPFKWLNITGRFGADIYSTQGNTFLHPEGQGQVILDTSVTPTRLLNSGTIENYNENSKLYNGQLLTTFKQTFGRFKTTLLVGSAFDDKSYETNSTYGIRLLLKDFNSINNTDLSGRTFKTTLIQQRSISAFGNLTVNYDDFLYLTVTGRNDWSSTLPVGNNSYFYPSFALSFPFTQLDMFKELGPLTYGKLRASFAEVGKDAPPYKVRSSLTSRPTTGAGFTYDFFGGNPNLQPERARGYEIGTELKFFNGRIGMDLAWFKNDRIKQISTQRLSYGTGFIFGLLNGGEISVRGLELQLTGSPYATADFEWDVIVNFSRSKSKVLELPAEVREFYNSDTWLYGGARGSAFPSNLQDFYSPAGFPYYNWNYLQRGMGSATAIGGVTYQRNNNGDILINPANGLPLKTADYLPIGDRNPDFMIGLTNSVRYKNLNISFLFDIRKGGDVFNGNEMYLFLNGLSTRSVDREKPVIIEGVLRDGLENSANPTRNTIVLNPYTMGSAYASAFAESDYVERDINWIRLRDITIAYVLPSRILSKQKAIKNASIFTTLTDVFMFTNYSGADPMVNGTNPATSGAGAFGFDFGSLSLPRSYTFGIKIGL